LRSGRTNVRGGEHTPRGSSALAPGEITRRKPLVEPISKMGRENILVIAKRDVIKDDDYARLADRMGVLFVANPKNALQSFESVKPKIVIVDECGIEGFELVAKFREMDRRARFIIVSRNANGAGKYGMLIGSTDELGKAVDKLMRG